MMVRNFSDDDLGTLRQIDRVIHEPARFLFMANLFVVEKADFLYLQQQTGLTRGNLSSHLSKLENAGYVKIEKMFVNKIPKTLLQLTDRGRAAIKTYRQNIKRMLNILPE